MSAASCASFSDSGVRRNSSLSALFTRSHRRLYSCNSDRVIAIGLLYLNAVQKSRPFASWRRGGKEYSAAESAVQVRYKRIARKDARSMSLSCIMDLASCIRRFCAHPCFPLWIRVQKDRSFLRAHPRGPDKVDGLFQVQGPAVDGLARDHAFYAAALDGHEVHDVLHARDAA